MRPRNIVRAILAVLLLGIGLTVIWAYRTVRSPEGLELARSFVMDRLAELAIEGSAGTLEQGRATRIEWRARGVKLTLEDVAWRLAPECLGRVTLCFSELSIGRLDIALQSSADDGKPFRLTAVVLPVALRVEHGTLGSLVVHAGEREYTRIEAIELDDADTHGSRIDVERLRARMPLLELAADLAGWIDLREQLPLEATGHVAWRDTIAAMASARGDLGHLAVRARGERDYPLDVEGSVDPLVEGVPLEFELRTREPFAPVPAQAEWARFDQALLKVKGTATRKLVAELEAKLLSTPLGENEVKAHGELAGTRFELQQLALQGALGGVQAQGAIELGGAREWNLVAELDQFRPPLLPAGIEARLGGPATLSGALGDGGPLLDATLDLAGAINEHQAALGGRVLMQDSRTFSLQGVRLASGPNELRLEGTVSDQTLALDGTLRIEDLGASVPDTTGHGSGELHIKGTRSEPDMRAHVELDTAAWSDTSVATLAADAVWQGMESNANRVQLDAHGVHSGGQLLDTLRLALQGSAASHELSAHADGKGVVLGLDCTGSLQASGDWGGACARLDAARADDAATWRLDKPMRVDWSTATRTLAIAPFCLRESGAALCSSTRAELSNDAWRGIALRASDLPIAALRSWIPETLNADGLLDLSLDVARAQGTPPRIEARLQSKLVALAPEAAGEPMPLVFSAIEASLHAGSGESRLAWKALVGKDGHTSAEFLVRGRDAQAPLTGRIVLEAIDVGSMLRVMPGTVRSEGWVDGHIDMAGTAADPQLAGELRLRDGALAHERLPQPIDAFALAVAFTGPDATISGQFKSAAGSGEVNGTAQWRERDWEAQLQFTAQKLLFEPVRGSTLTLAPKLRLELSQQHARIRGVLNVPAAKIDLDRVPQTAASVSEDTVIEGQVVAPERFDYSMNVNVKLGDDVRFKGFGAEARLGGAVRLRKLPGSPLNGNGDIRILEGRYAAYGQRLEVKDGAILFRGPLNRPELRIDATRRIEDEPGLTVGVHVRGDARLPELEVYTQPTMEESKAMAYLLTGRAPETGTGAGSAGSGALMALGTAGANRLTADTMAKLGVEDFQVESRAVEGGTEVHLSGYITPDLYLRYGVSTFEKVNTFRLRYRLTPKFFVEAVSGVENAVDFLYSFERKNKGAD